MVLDQTPQNNKTTTRDYCFNIVKALCNSYTGLSPFEVLNAPYDEVLDLYVDAIIRNQKDNKKKQDQEVEWVNSKNATWH